MTTPPTYEGEIILAVSGILRSAVGGNVAGADQVKYTLPTGQTIIGSAPDVQAVITLIIQHLAALEAQSGGPSGITEVAHDNTMTGRGTGGNPLGVATPLTPAEKAKLAALPDGASIVRQFAALPDIAAVGDNIVYQGQLYHRVSLSGAQTLTLQRGDDQNVGQDDQGYRSGRYGAVTDGNARHPTWLDALYWDDGTQGLILQLRSITSPGAITLRIPVQGTFTFARRTGTAYDNRGVGHWEYFAQAATNPFLRTASVTMTLTPASPITHWDTIHTAQVAQWAQAGDNSPIPASKLTNAPSGGLSESAVDDRVNHFLEDWATVGNDDTIPTDKIDSAYATTGYVDNAVAGVSAGGGLDADAVDAKIATHTGDADAHHTPPTLADLGGVNTSQVNTIIADDIATHAADVNAHHTPTAPLDAAGLVALIDNSEGNVDAAVSAGDNTKVALTGAAATGGGLNQAAVDARVEAYTGQTGAADTFARNRLPLATATEAGAISASDQVNVEQLVDVRNADSGSILVVNDSAAGSRALTTADAPYDPPQSLHDLLAQFGEGGWARVAGAVAQTHTAALADLTTVAGYTYGDFLAISPRAENRYVYVRLASGTSLVAKRRQVRIGEQDGVTGEFAEFDSSGWTLIGTTGGNTYYGQLAADLPAGDSVTLVEDDPASLNVETPAELTTVDASGFTGNLSTTDTDVQAALDTIDGLTLGGGRGPITLADLPAGAATDTEVAAAIAAHAALPNEHHTPTPALNAAGLVALIDNTEGNVDAAVSSSDSAKIALTGAAASGGALTADSVAPSNLVVETGSRSAGRFIKYNADVDKFDSEELIGQREVFTGALTGTFVSSVLANGQIGRTNLSDPVNINDEAHGLIGGTFTMSLTNRSDTTVGFDEEGADTIIVTGFVSLESIAASNPYNATSGDLGVVLVGTDVQRGATLLGHNVIRIARNADGLLDINTQYLGDAGGTGAASLNTAATGNLVVLATGVPRNPTGSAGPLYEYATLADRPAASAAIADSTLALVYADPTAANNDIYRKTSSITAGTTNDGMSGLSINPTGGNANLQQASDGRYTHLYVARTAFTNRGTTSLAANNARWSDMPAALSWLDFNYRTTTRADGQIRLVFSSARNLTGNIVITAGGTQYTLIRQSSTVWFLSGLNAGQVGALRENEWTFSTPGSGGETTTHEWTKLNLAGGGTGGAAPSWTTLLDYNPATPPFINQGGLTGRGVGTSWMWESPTALSPALTANDDNKMLIVEWMLSDSSNSGDNPGNAKITGREIWSMAPPIPVSDWRAWSNTPLTANAVRLVQDGKQDAVFEANTTAWWTRFITCKGPNGRPAIFVTRGVHVQRLRVRMQ